MERGADASAYRLSLDTEPTFFALPVNSDVPQYTGAGAERSSSERKTGSKGGACSEKSQPAAACGAYSIAPRVRAVRRRPWCCCPPPVGATAGLLFDGVGHAALVGGSPSAWSAAVVPSGLSERGADVRNGGRGLPLQYTAGVRLLTSV